MNNHHKTSPLTPSGAAPSGGGAAPTLVMPWGKHKDKTIEELLIDYLEWLAGNCDNEAICVAADRELNFRRENGVS